MVERFTIFHVTALGSSSRTVWVLHKTLSSTQLDARSLLPLLSQINFLVMSVNAVKAKSILWLLCLSLFELIVAQTSIHPSSVFQYIGIEIETEVLHMNDGAALTGYESQYISPIHLHCLWLHLPTRKSRVPNHPVLTRPSGWSAKCFLKSCLRYLTN